MSMAFLLLIDSEPYGDGRPVVELLPSSNQRDHMYFDDSGLLLTVLTIFVLFIVLPLLIPLAIGIVRGTGGRFWRSTFTGMGMGVLTVSAIVGWFALVANSPLAFTEAFFPALIGGVFSIIIGSFLLTRWVFRRSNSRA